MAKPLKNPDAPRLDKRSRNAWKMIQLHYAILREAAADGNADVDSIKQRVGILTSELSDFAAHVGRAQSTGHVPATATPENGGKGKAARA